MSGLMAAQSRSPAARMVERPFAGDVRNGEVVTEEGLPDEREGREMLGQGFPLVLGGAHDAEEAAEVV